MIHALDSWRELTMLGVTMRLLMAMVCGGMIGLSRGRSQRAKGMAGFRTYMLVCLGSTLTILLSQYDFIMVTTEWADIADKIGLQTDVSRFGAQVINGIGFLGAGTIIVSKSQEVRGLTTAAALWASACMGLAIGAGFFECALYGVFLILLTVQGMIVIERHVIDYMQHMNIYVEFNDSKDVAAIVRKIRQFDAQITNLDVSHGDPSTGSSTSAVIGVMLKHRQSHAHMIAYLSRVESITTMYEI